MNITSVRDVIAEAAAKSGRSANDVTVVAASKTVPAERLSALSSCGIFICGENRVQELCDKFGKVQTRWHMIGQLQTNKVKYLIGKAEMIQSLDRLSLAEEIERQCAKADITMQALIEVSVAGELAKGGVPYGEVSELLKRIGEMKHIQVKGLMAIPPRAESPEQSRVYFMRMRELYERLKQSPIASESMEILSMGMSNDYSVAIECGSNMVRLGRALFGERI